MENNSWIQEFGPSIWSHTQKNGHAIII